MKKTQEKCQLIEWWLIVVGPTDCINRIHYQAASDFFCGLPTKFMFCVFLLLDANPGVISFLCKYTEIHMPHNIRACNIAHTLHIPSCASNMFWKTTKQDSFLLGAMECLVVSGPVAQELGVSELQLLGSTPTCGGEDWSEMSEIMIGGRRCVDFFP